MRFHIAFMLKKYLQKIIDQKKTIESRFSMHKNLPYHQISENEIIYFKETGKPLILYGVIVERVKFYEFSCPGSFLSMIDCYQTELQLEEEWIQRKKNSKYGTLIWLKNLIKLSEPIDIKEFRPKNDQRSWLTIKSNHEPTLTEWI